MFEKLRNIYCVFSKSNKDRKKKNNSNDERNKNKGEEISVPSLLHTTEVSH